MSEAATSYRVLARAYRPQKLVDLIGQETTVKILKNAFAQDRVAHAYILTGVRGVGKTTTARIIAKAMNCPNATAEADFEPCGTCEICVAITDDRSLDVLELDAASRTGVDDMREIIDTISYKPVMGKKKVYIIDEVHMLSKNAFNALLKTLEEPPSHVIFIFATTDIHKVPVTILSRCQRFDLRRVDEPILVQHLQGIAVKEQIQLDEAAAHLIAQAAEGSVRDSLSLMDQAIVMADGAIGEDIVISMLGLVNQTKLLGLLDDVIEGRIEQSLAKISEYDQLGLNPLMLVDDLLHLIHYLTKATVLPEGSMRFEFSSQLANWLSEHKGRLSVAELTRLWQILLKGREEIAQAPHPLKALEMVVIRLAYVADLPTAGEIGSAPQNNTPPSAPPVDSAPPAPPAAAAAPEAENFGPSFEKPAEFTSLKDIIAQAITHRESFLAFALEESVSVRSFKQEHIVLERKPNAKTEHLSRLPQLLHQWTGKIWQVDWARATESFQSIQQEKTQAAEVTQQDVKAHPFVSALIDEFPDLNIKFIQ